MISFLAVNYTFFLLETKYVHRRSSETTMVAILKDVSSSGVWVSLAMPSLKFFSHICFVVFLGTT
jgi:hypothetical protein